MNAPLSVTQLAPSLHARILALEPAAELLAELDGISKVQHKELFLSGFRYGRDEAAALAGAEPAALHSLLAAIHRDGGQYTTEHGLEASVAAAMRRVPEMLALDEGWQPMGTAPKDGDSVLLLIEGGEHPLQDENPSVSIGAFGVHGGPEEDPTWDFAGWSWQQDCYCRGTGTPIGWMPMTPALVRAEGKWMPKAPTDEMIDRGGRGIAFETQGFGGALRLENYSSDGIQRENRARARAAYDQMFAAAPMQGQKS